MARESYPNLPANAADDTFWLLRVINGTMLGKQNVGGSFTIDASTTGPLTITDFRCGGQSVVLFCPRDDFAAISLYDDHLHLSDLAKESFDVDWNGTSPGTDAVFDYIVIG